jgi:hypothetical protein
MAGLVCRRQQNVRRRTRAVRDHSNERGEKEWKHQNDVLGSRAEFHSKGGELICLQFPRNEIQHFGDVAVIWSTYVLETEVDGKRSLSSSRVTEIFVYQRGHWTNPGWHTNEEK